jgi:hypothetical protein
LKRLILTLVVSSLLSGCFWLVAAGGTGTIGAFAWRDGNLARNYGEPLSTSWDATLYACRLQNLEVTEKKVDSFRGKIKANHDELGAVRIDLEKWTKNETEITVRVGVLGNRKGSEQIHDEIAKALR